MRFATPIVAALLAVSTLPASAGAGEKMYKEFLDKHELYADDRWQEYVQEVGARLLAQTPDRGKKYHFHVLDNQQVNAFATADAYIFVSRGLLAFIKSEDQLAAVVSHEIGHVVARHMRKRRVTDLAGKSLGIIAALATLRGELMRDVADPLTKLIVSGYGREMELEADRLGGEFMARAGYNPEAIIDTVWVLKDQQVFSKRVANRPVTYHGLNASHPKHDKRLHDAVAYARGMEPDELPEPVGDFWTLVDGLTYGDEASGGLVRDGRFFHRGLRVVVKFPESWRVRAPGSQVIGTAPGGKAEAAITFVRHEFVKRTTPAEYVEEVLKRDDVTAGEESEINGLPAYVGEIDTSESNVQAQLIAVLYRGQDVFVFRGECGPEGDPERFREQFQETLEALRPMTAADVKLANSRQIKVVVADPGTTYADLAQQTVLREHAEDMLRLLNADYPNGEPRAGDYVKIIQ